MHELTYDLIVAGGGTAGAAAAVAAARRGHRVLLVEELNCLGGISTAGGVGDWFASIDGLGNIFDHLVGELDHAGVRHRRCFNPEHLKFVWQEMAEAAGVQVLLHASVIGVEAHDHRLTSVRIASCSHEMVAQARYFIDATGEGDLAALAGAEYLQGDPATGLTLHMTLTGWLYDTGAAVTPWLPDGLEPIDADADLPGLGVGYLDGNRRVYMNATKIMGHDPTDPFSLTRAEMEARRQLFRILHYAQRTRFPTFTLAGTGARIGIREGRRILGDYLLTTEEVTERQTPLDFPDGIAVATCQIDFHSLTRAGHAGWRQRLEPYAIPFRCLIVKGFANLLVAGKCLSADQVVQSSCRMTPTCCAMGQAAGAATALAIEAGASDIRQVPAPALRAVLAADGMELDPARHQAFAPHDTRLDLDDMPSGVGDTLG